MSRPRYSVLLWCADVAQWSAVRYVIELRTLTMRVVREIEPEMRGALVVCTAAGDGSAAMVAYLQNAVPDLPVMVWDPGKHLGKDCASTLVLHDDNMAAMLERLRVLQARTPGPKTATGTDARARQRVRKSVAA